MQPRPYRAPKPLNTQPNPRKTKQSVVLEKATALRKTIEGKTQRQLYIEKGIITPRKRR